MKVRSSKRGLAIAAALAAAFCLWCGCGRDARLAGKKLPKIETRTVEMYGLTLDRQASPEQVAYAALMAIREDFLACSEAEREAALEKQFALAAGKTIAERDRTSLSPEEAVYHVVYHWTPTVSHYVSDFPASWEQAKDRLVLRKTWVGKESKVKEAEVAMQVADPSGDPRTSTVMLIWLAQEDGYWRVMHFGFDSRHRTIVAAGSKAAGENEE